MLWPVARGSLAGTEELVAHRSQTEEASRGLLVKIEEYWNRRASADANTATTNDVYLRVLEREVLTDHLRQLGCGSDSWVLDLGCGDGQTILHLGRQFGCWGIGIDYSPAMVQLANERLQDRDNEGRITYRMGDLRRASDIVGGQQFDFALTDRALINVEKSDEQYTAIGSIAKLVKDNGYYLAIENFEDGNERLNQLRQLFELPPIPVRWHNRYFKETDFVRQAGLHFREVGKVEFSSSYYLATRVIYSKFCQIEGVEPDYLHPIHRLSILLPQVGDFSPIKLFVMRK